MTNEAEERAKKEFNLLLHGWLNAGGITGVAAIHAALKHAFELGQAARAASPVSAPDSIERKLLRSQKTVAWLLIRLETADSMLQELGYARQNSGEYVAVAPVSSPITLDQAREWRKVNWYDSVPEMLDKALAAFANYAAKGVAPVSAEQPTKPYKPTREVLEACKVLRFEWEEESGFEVPMEPEPSYADTFVEACALFMDLLDKTAAPSVASEDSATQPDWMKADTLFGVYCGGDASKGMRGIDWEGWQRLSDYIAKHFAASQLSTEKKG